MFLQGDAERAAGVAISPLCDRSKAGVLKSQVGFFSFVVSKLVHALHKHCPVQTPCYCYCIRLVLHVR